MKNINKVPPYWDDGQRGPTYFHWFRKGKWKRWGRKKWIKEQLRSSARVVEWSDLQNH